MRTFRETAYWTAVLALGAGMLIGTPASADSTDNDGVNLGNDNNLSVLPVQLCGNNVAVLGAVAPIASPQNVECVNAPIVDHPEKPDTEEPPTDEPPSHEPPGHQPPGHEPPGHEPPGHQPPSHEPPAHQPPSHSDEVEDAEELPTAPAPEATEGHVAVTG
ncbi:hypothetical protein [Saccharopolyspora sp. NPDC049357]|uniref:hypothetical protein n=1 Tax=Saccharopolyspora sp. NPDC049357 TaxID=3154507 RepID=UPI0034373329